MPMPLRLDQARWSDPVWAALNEAAARSLSSAGAPPVAVFDFDETCITGDIGELFSHYLIDEMLYRFDLDAFWALIDPQDGRDEIRALVKALSTLKPDARRQSPLYQQYLAEMGAVYMRKYTREGPAPCYEWAVRLHVGMTPAEIRRHTLRAIERELKNPRKKEVRQTSRGNQVTISRGIRVHEEIRQLIPALERAGFEVWIVSATNRWSVEVFAQRAFGVPPNRVLGNQLFAQAGAKEIRQRLATDTCHLSATTRLPVLYRKGKVDMIEEAIGRRPALAFGDTFTDLEMLQDARELAVLIDRGEPELQREAALAGWAVQPQAELTRTQTLKPAAAPSI